MTRRSRVMLLAILSGAMAQIAVNTGEPWRGIGINLSIYFGFIALSWIHT